MRARLPWSTTIGRPPDRDPVRPYDPISPPIRDDPWQPGYWRHTHPWSLKSKPEIVTLCGSTQFVDEFNRLRKQLTLKGMIVLSIEIVTTQRQEDDPQLVDPHTKSMLDALHFEKIKMSDFIFVINRGGYIGPSTRNEIEFARSIGKPIEYLEGIG